ncbi:DUF1161 domain-containing protein [Uliginosibacterium paludis]|uniref:DUF1161 domain-containing protein n=1 Tax=Uliginosibacterium paludis TaxID=1615952 RepID=A0ABV2CKB3_9RHOO
MKRVVIALSLAALSVPAFAKMDCAELKSAIAAKIESKGVTAYTLEVVDKGQGGSARIVGSCEGGAKEIAYVRGKAAPAAAAPESK